MGLNGNLCFELVSIPFRGLLFLQLLVSSSFCSCNTVLREHSSKRNNMILADTQLNSRHSAIFVIAQSPLRLFTETYNENFLSLDCPLSQVTYFSDWPPDSRLFNYCYNHLTDLIAFIPAPKTVHFTHKQVIFLKCKSDLSLLYLKSFNGF